MGAGWRGIRRELLPLLLMLWDAVHPLTRRQMDVVNGVRGRYANDCAALAATQRDEREVAA